MQVIFNFDSPLKGEGEGEGEVKTIIHMATVKKSFLVCVLGKDV